MLKSLEYPDQPINKNIIRADILRAGLMVKENDTDIRLVTIDQIDMKGWFPT